MHPGLSWLILKTLPFPSRWHSGWLHRGMAGVALRSTQATDCMPAVVALHRTACGGVFRQRLAAAGKPTSLIHAAYGVLKSRQAFDPA
jgi:hypothetical protein